MRVHKKEVSTWRGSVFLMGAIVATVALVGTKVLADDAYDIETYSTGGENVQYDDASGAYPIITAIASQPGVFFGHTYTGWSLLAEDATGSLDLFTTAATLTNLPGAADPGTPYSRTLTPAVGDMVNVSGQWTPFDEIPELGFVTAVASNNYINKISGGNPLPATNAFSISQINIPTISNHVEFAGTLIEISNVVITATNGLTAFPGYTNSVPAETMTITDNSGSMTLFDWTTSYSGAAALSGTPINGAPVDLYGFVDAFVSGTNASPEFVPLAVVPVPEPSSVVMVGAGLLGLLAIRRRRS